MRIVRPIKVLNVIAFKNKPSKGTVHLMLTACVLSVFAVKHVCWQMNDGRTVIEVKAWMTTVSKEGTFSPNPFKRVQDSTYFHVDWGLLQARGFHPETLSVWACKVTTSSITFKILWIIYKCSHGLTPWYLAVLRPMLLTLFLSTFQ